MALRQMLFFVGYSSLSNKCKVEKPMGKIISRVNEKKYVETKFSVICSPHFKGDDFKSENKSGMCVPNSADMFLK